MTLFSHIEVKELETDLEREKAGHCASIARVKELERTVETLRNSLLEGEGTISTLNEKLDM